MLNHCISIFISKIDTDCSFIRGVLKIDHDIRLSEISVSPIFALSKENTFCAAIHGSSLAAWLFRTGVVDLSAVRIIEKRVCISTGRAIQMWIVCLPYICFRIFSVCIRYREFSQCGKIAGCRIRTSQICYICCFPAFFSLACKHRNRNTD